MGQTLSAKLESVAADVLATEIMQQVSAAGSEYDAQVLSLTKEEPVVKDITTTLAAAKTDSSGSVHTTPSAVLLAMLLAGICSLSTTKKERTTLLHQ